jgi:hypothetical protein
MKGTIQYRGLGPDLDQSLSGRASSTDFEARPRANVMSEILC